MQTRRIGSLEVSVIGLGCNNFGWRIDAEASAKVIDAAIESGLTFFDTADRYGKGQSEEFDVLTPPIPARTRAPNRNCALITTTFRRDAENQHARHVRYPDQKEAVSTLRVTNCYCAPQALGNTLRHASLYYC